MFISEEEAPFMEEESRTTTPYSRTPSASLGPTQSSAVVFNGLMLPSVSGIHHLTVSNNSLYTSNHLSVPPDTAYTMGERLKLLDSTSNDSRISSQNCATPSPDQYASDSTTNIYVCTKDGCMQQFTSLSEIQQHDEERHQSLKVLSAYHSFYVLHSTLSRYGFYNSAVRFWCRLCSTEKGFETSLMLRDHAQKCHPWILVPEQIDIVPDVLIARSPSAVIVGPESIPDMPRASRCSSYDTIGGELADVDPSEGGQVIHKRKKRGKNGQLDWEAHRKLLSELYITQDHSLDQVMEHMSSTYRFHAKLRAYKERFKLWGFDKNVPARDMGAIVALVEKRKREDGKDSLVFFKGRPINPLKMERYKRRKMDRGEIGDAVAIPSHIRCETPPSGSPTTSSQKPDDSSHIPRSCSSGYSLKGLADATFNDYWALMGYSRVNVPGEPGCQTFSDHARALLSHASAHETRDDNEGAERMYREVLELPDTEKDSTAVFDALRGVVRIHAKAEELGFAIPELERLVAGCLCFFGPEHETYISLALELAVKHYILGRKLEGNVLMGRLLEIYEKSSSVKIHEDSCAFLLTRASRWNPEFVETPRFNAVYWRIIEQYELAKNWEDSVTLTVDIIELLQDKSSQERVLAKTTESYLRRAYSLYTRHEKHGRYAHCNRLLDCTLVQLNEGGGSWMDRVLVLFNVLQNDLTAQYFSAAPIAHHRQPITKLVRCYEALSQPLKVTELVSEVRTRSALARHWSPLDWEVFIEELRAYARELQEKVPNTSTIKELLSMARDFETVKNLME
ncbi:hypothetical protein MMC11_007152 [Xylographa trunciseda]|nr:hypothetical protein [Xylographa trunciseda]